MFKLLVGAIVLLPWVLFFWGVYLEVLGHEKSVPMMGTLWLVVSPVFIALVAYLAFKRGQKREVVSDKSALLDRYN